MVRYSVGIAIAMALTSVVSLAAQTQWKYVQQGTLTHIATVPGVPATKTAAPFPKVEFSVTFSEEGVATAVSNGQETRRCVDDPEVADLCSNVAEIMRVINRSERAEMVLSESVVHSLRGACLGPVTKLSCHGERCEASSADNRLTVTAPSGGGRFSAVAVCHADAEVTAGLVMVATTVEVTTTLTRDP